MTLPLWASTMQAIASPPTTTLKKTLYGYNARVFYEVFAVSARRGEDTPLLLVPPWSLLAEPSVIPNVAISSSLDQRLGLVPDVVHSTSWRYAESSFFLTFLAVLPWGDACAALPFQPIRETVRVQGDALLPPPSPVLSQDAVLTHALDHLASLFLLDSSIRARLAPPWASLLVARSPLPAHAFLTSRSFYDNHNASGNDQKQRIVPPTLSGGETPAGVCRSPVGADV